MNARGVDDRNCRQLDLRLSGRGVISEKNEIGPLTDAHWKVIEFLQKDYAEKGTLPTIRRMKKAGGIPTKELYELYPDGPVKKASKIAGLPKPESCI